MRERVVDHRRRVARDQSLGQRGRLPETIALEIKRLDRTDPTTLDEALALADERGGRLLVNARSGHAAVQVRAASVTLDDGEVERRISLVRPTERKNMAAGTLDGSHWEEADVAAFTSAWNTEVASLPEFVEPLLDRDRHAAADLAATAAGRMPGLSSPD